ncbi:MAG TPA: hypothetical protein VHP83_07455 [Aggregatilineaceae bacterium]|nr:hypothetical protein [Aggregatilineaceae bacterium]
MNSTSMGASLTWAEHELALQPEAMRYAYHQAAHEIVRTLNRPVYTTTVSIPYGNPQQQLVVHAGTLGHQIFKKMCGPVLMQKLQLLMTHHQQPARDAVRLTCYLAAQQLLFSLPDEQTLQRDYTGFDQKGNLLTPNIQAAEAVVERLVAFLHLLHQIETLYPAWAAADRFSETHALLTTHLIHQGRALANFHTQKIIRDIMTAWKSSELTRGLTIFLPYFDEHHYRMEEYKIVVIPQSRILFRPEFVVGACRVSERHVRSASNLSQSTRWQLLSQLDTIIQAFESTSIG